MINKCEKKPWGKIEVEIVTLKTEDIITESGVIDLPIIPRP